MVMSSVLRSLEVFEKVAELQPARLGELTRLLGWPKSTVQRSLETLAEAGWILPIGDDYTRWFVAPRIQTLVLRTDEVAALRQAAQPVMEELASQTGTVVQLSIPSARDKLTTIETVEGVRSVVPLGSTIPKIFTVAGLSMMAHYSDEALLAMYDEGIRNGTYARVGRALSREDLMVEIERARRDGFAQRTDRDAGISYVASAIQTDEGDVIGSLTIWLPVEKFALKPSQEWGSLLRGYAERISSALTEHRVAAE